MWQEFVFLAGSFATALAPTLRRRTSRVPLGTSFSSAALRFAYVAAFLSLEMVSSAVGVFVVGVTWSLVAVLRRPSGNPTVDGGSTPAGRPT